MNVAWFFLLALPTFTQEFLLGTVYSTVHQLLYQRFMHLKFLK